MSAKRETTAEPAVTLNVPEFEAPADFISIAERFLYRAGPAGVTAPGFTQDDEGRPKAHCGSVPIQGYILDVKAREDKTGNGRDFNQIAVHLTRPCIGISDEKHVEMKPGEIIVVTETAALVVFEIVALHASRTVEVYLRPAGMKALKNTNGHKMRVWERKVSRNTKLRAELPMFSIEAAFGSDEGLPPQLQGDVSKPMTDGRQVVEAPRAG